jgi:DNA-binding NtrC family response regulator
MPDTDTSTDQPKRGTIVAVIPDVFFSVTVRNTIRRLGFEAVVVRNVESVDEAATRSSLRLIILDATALRTSADWDAVSGLRAADIPVLAFGPHKDIETLRQAKTAGVSRVVANSLFHRDMPDLIERYAK